MSTLAIARKEFADAIRSRALVLMATLFAAVLMISMYFQLYMALNARFAAIRDPARVVSRITAGVNVLIPVLGTMLGYKAIVAERESGSLTLLLTLPHTRRDVVLSSSGARR